MSDDSALYQSLDSSNSEFRLLRVFGLHDGVPDCELITTTLQSDSVHWNALSYRWGDDEATETITVNCQVFLVRPSLFRFLKRLAEDDDENVKPIFVDAICINQSDFDERNIQVLLMGGIYKRAAKVLVWMVPNLDDRMAYELEYVAATYAVQRFRMHAGRPLEQVRHRQLRKVSKLPRATEGSDFLAFEFQPSALAGEVDILKIEETRYSRAKFGKNRKYTFESGAIFTRLQSLIDHIICVDSYWTRLWIIQEILLAKELEFWFLTWKWPERNMFGYASGSAFEKNDTNLQGWVMWVSASFQTPLMPVANAIRTNLDEGFQFALDRFPQQDYEQMPISRDLAFIALRGEFRESTSKGLYLDFCQAFMVSHFARCHHIEDKVLGMMGITRMHRTPLYGMPQEELFIDIAANYIASVRSWKAELGGQEDGNLLLRGQSAVMFAFGIPVAHAWVMLVFSLALDIFGYSQFDATDVAVLYERIHIKAEYTNHKGKLKLPKKWYQSRDSALFKLSATRGIKNIHRLMQIKDEAGWIWCPLETLKGDDSRHGEYFSDWVDLIRARIMPVWHYYQEQNGDSHEVEPTLSPCWTIKGLRLGQSPS
jgi:hypothetical protein